MENLQLLENEENGKYGSMDKLKGVLSSFLMTLAVGASSVSVPLLERKIPDFELNVFRSSISFIFVTIAVVVTKQWPRIPTSEIPGIVVYSLVAFVSSISIYLSVSLVPLSYYKSLYFTFNMLTGLILFPKLVGEKTDLKAVLFSFLCVAGVVLSIQPEFIFTWKKDSGNFVDEASKLNSSNTTTTVAPYLHHSSSQTLVGCILASVAGLVNCIDIIVLKRRPYIGENVIPSLFWIVLSGTILSLITMGIFEKPILPETWEQILLISIHSVSFSLVYVSSIFAAKYISGNTMNIIFSSLVVLMLIPQYTLLEHILPGNRNWIEVLGSMLVFIGATAVSILEIAQQSFFGKYIKVKS